MTTKTKVFSSTCPGAPVLSGQPGSLLGILDACLVTGFGLQTATSVTIADGFATVNFGTAPNAELHTVVVIAGATPAGLNGEQRITEVAGNSVKFATAVTGTVTGTVTMKVAPLGWSKPFTDTDVAVFKMISPESTGMCLRVDDTFPQYARVRGYMSMTGVSTGEGAFPATNQGDPLGLWWNKSVEANSTARRWRITGDDRGFYFHDWNRSDAYESIGHYFGDIKSLKSGDPYAVLLKGTPSDLSSASGPTQDDVNYNNWSLNLTSGYVAKDYHGLGGSVVAVQVMNAPLLIMNNFTPGSSECAMPFPNPVDNGLILSNMALLSFNTLRGYYPGAFFVPQYASKAFNSGEYTIGTGPLAGKPLLAVKNGSTVPSSQGVMFLDVTSDWRA